MAEENAKLRSDLEILADENSGVLVKDPVTRRFYRFSSVQASVLELLGGQRDYESIAADVSGKHGVEATAEQIAEFAGKLRDLLLLDHAYCWAQLRSTAPTRRKSFQNIFRIKIWAFNPDGLLTRLTKRSRFFFSASFQYFFGFVAVVALVLSILHWKSLFHSLAGLFSLYSLPLILVVAFAIVTVHEFAHGITLKHFGGKVEEMGIMLLYFIPAFYCNTSDAWMLKKREKILVALAGGYIQIFLWAVATIFWRLAAPETLISRICIISIVFNGILVFFNFNPLIRLDGYYMLSDFIEIPNLRTKAFSYLKHKLVAWLTGSENARKVDSGHEERRILLLYGTASFLFTIGIVLYMVHLIGGWMIREYRTWGAIIAAMLFVMTMPAVGKENATSSGKFLKAVFTRIYRSPRRSIALLLLFLCAFLPWELKISSDFTIVPLKQVQITPQVEGHITKIFVDQGSRVAANSILAEIENLDLAESYQDTRGELAAQNAALDLLKAGSRPEEIEKVRRLIATKKSEYENASRINKERAVLGDTVAKREAELANARLNHERTMSLLQNGLIARNEADRYRTIYEVSQKELSEAMGQLNVLEEQTERIRDIKRKELAQAESELQLLLAGSRSEDIRAAESQVAKLEEKLKILEKELNLLKIRSPIDGVIATPYLRNRIGDYLDKGDVFCLIVSQGAVTIEMPIPEKEIGEVQLGLPITMKVRGFPHKRFEAEVKSIAPVTDKNGSERIVTVKGELENRDGSLKPGMTGVGKILCGKRMILEIASRRALRWLRTEFWEYLP
ncbi:MAG: efflux RND transporter periplasmic adaptor subunit [Acidobacteria bacterium]|nr:efflux RND transporter periplasmic adaptor subunit [Acidobacteriota bacterium]